MDLWRERQTAWESAFYEKRREFIKSIPHLEDNKKPIINRLVIEKQLSARESESKGGDSLNAEIEATVKQKGLHGLSLKEKRQICLNSLTLQKTFYRNYLYKIEESQNRMKVAKWEEKVQQLGSAIEEKEREYAGLSESVKTLYKD